MTPRDLSDHTEYRAGRGIEEVARELGRAPDEFITLSSNENALGPSPDAVTALRTAAENAHRYPKASHTDLTDAIAEYWGISREQVWLANGSDGALDYLARALLDPGDPVLVPTPGFAYYPMSAKYHHGTVRTYQVSRETNFALTTDTVLPDYHEERIVYLTSPHNPTGGRFRIEDIESIAAETHEQTLVVVDEAYQEYSEHPSAIPLIDERDDIAVLRTFSKAYGLAGCRLGYAIVPESWADAYARVNTPFAANDLACRAGLAALNDHDHLTDCVELARWSRDFLTTNLDTRVWESHANFVLTDVGDARGVTAELQDRGVIVRDCSSFGLPQCIRITCGTKPETTRVVTALNEVVP